MKITQDQGVNWSETTCEQQCTISTAQTDCKPTGKEVMKKGEAACCCFLVLLHSSRPPKMTAFFVATVFWEEAEEFC